MGKPKKKEYKFLNPGDPWEHWIQKHEIGDGSFGKVYFVTKKDGSINSACKICAIESEMDKEDMAQEVQILLLCKSPYVLQVYEAYFNGKVMHMFLELCTAGALDDVLLEFECGFPETYIKAVMYQTFKGLDYLHKLGVIHRDIKAGNMLLTDSGYLKLADFGVSALNQSAGMKRSTFIGTPYWMAPEVILTESHPESQYGAKCDVWSTGVTCIELAETQPPNHEHHPTCVLFYIIKNPPPTYSEPEKWSNELKDFTAKCLTFDANKRPSAEEALKHPFVSITENESKDIVRDMFNSFKDVAVEEDVEVDIDLNSTDSQLNDNSNSLQKDDTIGKYEPKELTNEPSKNLKTVKRTKRIHVNGQDFTTSSVRVVDGQNNNIFVLEAKLREKHMNEIKRLRRLDTIELNKKKDLLESKYEELQKSHSVECQKLDDRLKDICTNLETQFVKDISRKESSYMDDQKKNFKKLKVEFDKEMKLLKPKTSKKSSHISTTSNPELAEPLEKYRKLVSDFVNSQVEEYREYTRELTKTKQACERAHENERMSVSCKHVLDEVEFQISLTKEVAIFALFQSEKLFKREQQLLITRRETTLDVTKKRHLLEFRDLPKNQRNQMKALLDQQKKNYRKQIKNGLLGSEKSEKEYLREVFDAEAFKHTKEREDMKRMHEMELQQGTEKYVAIEESILLVRDDKQKELLVNCIKNVNKIKEIAANRIQELICTMEATRDLNDVARQLDLESVNHLKFKHLSESNLLTAINYH